MTGIHEQPETVSKGVSGRMVISSIVFDYVPHLPHAIAVSSSSPQEELNSIFWSDIGSTGTVYRALTDGMQLQPVMLEVRLNDSDIFLA